MFTLAKKLNLLLIATSLIGYLEWSGDSHSFLFQAEYEVINKLLTDPLHALHPFTVLPLLGQILLLVTLFQKNPSKILTYCGLIGLALLLGFMFFIGIMGLNYKIILSTIPFLSTAGLRIVHLRRSKSQ